jgi:hypothetical protein
MYEFGRDQRFGHLSSESRRALFEDVAKVINGNKFLSVASTLSSDNYRAAFGGLTDLSMYGASFTQVAMVNDVAMRKGDYKGALR